ncbi:insulinase family protein [Azotobacter vinelandii]
MLVALRPLGRDDVLAFHRDFYGADRGEFVLSGNFDPQQVERQVRRLFGDWNSKARYARPARPYRNVSAARLHVHAEAPRTGYYLARLHFDAGSQSQEQAALFIAERILGRHPLVSRLGQRLREGEKAELRRPYLDSGRSARPCRLGRHPGRLSAGPGPAPGRPGQGRGRPADRAWHHRTGARAGPASHPARAAPELRPGAGRPVPAAKAASRRCHPAALGGAQRGLRAHPPGTGQCRHPQAFQAGHLRRGAGRRGWRDAATPVRSSLEREPGALRTSCRELPGPALSFVPMVVT